MTVYWANLIIVSTIAFLCTKFKKSTNGLLGFALLYLFVISSFRDRGIGADYEEYVRVFYSVREGYNSYMEKGYVLLNRMLGRITDQYCIIAIATNLLLFIPLYYYLTRNVSQKYRPLCVFIFAMHPYLYLQSTFNAMRQSCATGIIIIGMIVLIINEANKKGIVYYSILVLIASFFHKIAFVFLLVPFIMVFPWRRVHWWIGVGVSLIVNNLGGRGIIAYVSRKLGFGGYLQYESSYLNRPIYIIFVAVTIIVFARGSDLYYLQNKKSRMFANLYLFSLCVLLASLSNDMFFRVYIIFAFLSLPGIPVVCETIKNPGIRLVFKEKILGVNALYYSYYTAYYVGYILLLFVNNNIRYIPFSFFQLR